MEGRKFHGSGHTQRSMLRTTSTGSMGSNNNVQTTKEKSRKSEDGTLVDALPPKPSGTTATSSGATCTSSGASGKTGGNHMRLGGLSRYLLEMAQNNDSGLDLSPATLQSIVHPLRNSNSSSSSASGRSLFESPASFSEESPQLSTTRPNLESSAVSPTTTSTVSKSVLSEQSHNVSETTVIEKTLTDEQSSKVIVNISKHDLLEPINEDENKTNPVETKESISNKPRLQGYPKTHPSPADVTPKDRGFQVPYSHHYHQDRSKQRFSNGNNENTDPATSSGGSRTYVAGNQHHQQNDSFPSSEIAAAIPSGNTGPTNGDHTRKSTLQTPKPKSCRKKPAVPSSTKKPFGSGWKFLSEHVNNKEFLILEQLGKGGCGEVSLVMEKDTRKQYALKVVQLHGIEESLVQECINEVEMLIDLKGTDLVVDIYNWEFNRSEKTMKILMEKGQCDLNHTINRAIKTKNPIKLLKLRYIWESLLTIVQEIHSKGIVHADLKPANFVWFDDNLKIIDFGIASRLQSDLTSIAMPNPKGTLNFISPEIIKLDDNGRSKLSPKSDIWALGCILYLMVYGRTPFDHIVHPVTKMNAIVQGDIMYPTLPPHLRESDVLSVLKLCFQTDYKRRPSATELLRHFFIRS